jgi:hypothetical protein
MAHRMTSIGFRSALLAMAVVGSSLLAAANAQDSAPAANAPPAQEPVRSSEKSEYRRIDADLPLGPVSQLLGEIQRDYKVSAFLWGSNNGRTIAPTIVVKGVPGNVNDAMKAVDAAIADTSRWEVTKRIVELTPVGQESDLSVREVMRLLGMTRGMRDAEAVLIDSGADSNVPLRLLLTGKKEAVDKAEAHINDIIASEAKWRELRNLQEAESTVTIDFPGGTVEEFINAVIGKFNFVPPIYQDESFRKLSMRPVKTRLLDIPSALDLLSRVPPLDPSGASVPLRATFGNIDPQLSASAGRRSDALPLQLSRAVMVIDRAEPTKVDTAPARRAAFSLGDDAPKRELLDATLDVLSVAINLDGPSKTFRAKFHAPSNILIVQGTPDELAVAGQVVKARFPKAKIELPSEPKS